MVIFQAWVTCALLNNKISAFLLIPLQQHSFPALSRLKERPWEQVRLHITFICDWRADSSSPFDACSMVCLFGGQDGSNIFQCKVCVLEKQQTNKQQKSKHSNLLDVIRSWLIGSWCDVMYSLMSLFCDIFVLFVIGTLPRKKRFLSGMAFNIYEVVNSRSLSCQSRSWFVYPPREGCNQEGRKQL